MYVIILKFALAYFIFIVGRWYLSSKSLVMKRMSVVFISLFLAPIGAGDNKEARSYETKIWKKILQTYIGECEFPRQEVLEPLFGESLDSHIGRV